MAYGAALVLVVLVAVELLSYAAIAIVERGPTRVAALNERQDALMRGGPQTHLDREVRYRAHHQDEVVHPYIGFVLAPWEEMAPQLLFADSEVVSLRRSPDVLLVGVAGGSVGAGFAALADRVLAPRLARSPALAGRKVVIVSLAMGGWKQPQQLMALSYLLAVGAELDVLVNLDGFNEVALHAVENQARGVFPVFPRNWYMRVRPVPDPVMLPVVGRIAELEIQRKRWARELRRPPLRWSAAAGFVWLARHRMLEAEIFAAQRTLLEYAPEQGNYAWTGPQVEFESEAALYEELVAIWSRSSTQLHRLSQANGIRYLHLLQPNQYVEGSKPMGAEERRAALHERNPFRPGAEAGYPLLIRECQRLAERGVPCHDLTQLFADVPEPIYTDDCCHFNGRGYELVGAYAAEVLLEEAGSGMVR